MKLDYFISWVTQSLLFVAFLSGLPLVFFYYTDHAYESVQKITSVVSYGYFFRKLHYFSSEAAVFFLIFHAVYELFLQKIPKEKKSYIFASFASLFVLLLLYTGYVLKADQSGKAAALVGENILKDSVLLKHFLSFIIDKTYFYWRFFLWHVIFLPLLMFWFVYEHIEKKIYPNISFFVLGVGISVVLSYLIKLPPDIPYNVVVRQLEGPWFFQGIENMLKLNFPVDLSIFIGLFPFLVLSVYLYLERYGKILKLLLLIWLAYYAFVSLNF